MTQDARTAPPFSIRVAATFSAEPLSTVLASWGADEGLDMAVEYVPGDLLRPGKAPAGSGDVVLVRLKDSGRHGPDGEAAEPSDGSVAELAGAVRDAARRHPVLVVLCPSPDPEPAAERWLIEAIAGLPGVHVVSSAELVRWYPEVSWHGPASNASGGRLYTKEGFTALSEVVARVVRSWLASHADRAGGGVVSAAPVVAPRTPVEQRVMELWTDLLVPPPRSVHDNFFELSGDSLKLVQFLRHSRRAFGVELPTTTLFQSSLSIAEIAAAIEEALVAKSTGVAGTDVDDLADELLELSDDELDALLSSDDNR